MSTRYELARLKRDGSFETILLKRFDSGVNRSLVDEIKTSLSDPQAVESLFSGGGYPVQTFADESGYRAYLTDGPGAAIEYIYLWDEEKAQWSVLLLNGREWLTERLESAGVDIPATGMGPD